MSSTGQQPISPQEYVSFSVSTWGSSQAEEKAPVEPPQETVGNRSGGFGWRSEETKKLLVKSMFMSLFAILGALLRIVVAQLFGEECANPGTVGWLKAGSPLCVTADGNAGRQGGIVFADLPANLLGSFIMGMMQPTTALDLPGKFPVAWLKQDSFFQSWDIVHLAVRTGFCGSLTTFSSWNSEMVVMIVGTGSGSHASQLARGIFGYAIGMETALGSFVFGKKVAEWLYRWQNPLMAKEWVALPEKLAEGVYINNDLPDFERRYLSNLPMDWMGDVHNVERTEALEKWRVSTAGIRRVGHEFLPTMLVVENAVLVDRTSIPHRADGFARQQGWDVEALLEWGKGIPPKGPKKKPNDHPIFTMKASVAPLLLVTMGLVTGLLLMNSITAYTVTYRTMLFAMLVAPPGALLRWYLSGWNGIFTAVSWLPVGTLTANVIGCLVSITMIGFEYAWPVHGFWTVATLRAVKVGFAGSLTTVSTFVSEVSSLMKNKVTNDRGYMYIMISILPSCILSLALYLVIVVTANKL